MVFSIRKLRGPGSSLRFKEDGMFKEQRQKKNYVAVGNIIPEKGRQLDIWRFESDFGHFFPASVLTSTVEKVEQLAGNMFRVETRNSIYYVQVIIACSNMYVGFSDSSPQIGQRMRCIVVRDFGKGLEVLTINTSKVKKIEEIGSIFRVETKNSIYYVQC
jgi:hypothetical protein